MKPLTVTMTVSSSPQPAAPSLEQVLELAVSHYQAGRLQDAEDLYRAILETQPAQPDANHNMGVLAVHRGQPAVGLPYFKAALLAGPEQPRHWLSYIEALIQTGQEDIARQVLAAGQRHGLQGPAAEALAGRLMAPAQIVGQASTVRQGSDSGEPPPTVAQSGKKPEELKVAKSKKVLGNATFNKTGGKVPSPQELSTLMALYVQGRFAEAVTLARSLTTRFPRQGFGWKVLGHALLSHGRLEEALPPMQKAAELSPGDAEVHNILGNVLAGLRHLSAAEASYRRTLEIKPGFADAHMNLGIVLRDLGQFDGAAASFRRALEIKPDAHNVHSDLGVVLRDLGQFDEAAASCRRALEIKPDFAEAHSNLGGALHSLGRLDDAVTCHRRALALKPDLVEAHNSLGCTLRDLGQLDEAVASYRRVLEIKPDYAEAHINLSVVLCDLGQFDDAAASCRRGLEIRSDFPEAHSNLGNALRGLGQFDDAMACHRRALALKPDLVEAHNSLGIALHDLGQLDGAVASYLRALAIKSDYAEAYYNLGNTLRLAGVAATPDVRKAEAPGAPDARIQGGWRAAATGVNQPEPLLHLDIALQSRENWEAALCCFQRALQLKPDFPDAHFGLGQLQLQMGDLENGWKGYEYRSVKRDQPVARRGFPQPHWEGESLEGKSILIWGEQGVGDELQWATMYQEIIARADRCVIECAAKLMPLFARAFPGAQVVAKTDPPHPAALEAIDCQCAAGSLARWLRPTVDSFPSENNYLIADPARVAYWKARLAALGPQRKIGFSWRSGNMTGTRPLHCTPLDQWGPILTMPGVHFINLQYGECGAELARARQSFGMPLHAFDEVDLRDDLDEAAALTQAVDIVISAPTAVSCLAAALGVETWMMNYGRAWQMLGTDRFPLFPTVRLYPRWWNQAWGEIVQDIACELHRRR